MARINVAEILREAAKNTGRTNDELRKAVHDRAKVIFNDAVKGLQKSFEEHSVTKEIDGGITASNISNTLQGGAGRPPNNLFSYIGFPQNGRTRPTDAIRKRLDPDEPSGPKLSAGTKVPGQNAPTFRFNITFNLEGIFKATPLPWATELSWAEKIESGLENFAFFLATTDSPTSLSGGGIQTKKEVYPNASYVPPSNGYLRVMVDKFGEAIRNFKRQQNK